MSIRGLDFWVFAARATAYKGLSAKGFYMEPHCEKPVEGWPLIVLTLLTRNIYNPS